jgi:hypothetical protein
MSKSDTSQYFFEMTKPGRKQRIGFLDPGPNPDPVTQWMAYVNCPLCEGNK